MPYPPIFAKLIKYFAIRPQPIRNVNARAVYFRGNFVNLRGSNAGIVTEEIGKIHRKDATLALTFLVGWGLIV